MSNVVISVENIGKKYRIRHQGGPRYVALRDVVAHKFATPVRWLRDRRGSRNGSQSPALLPQISTPGSREDFWALKDVSFEVKQGEVVGIIGRNGAGKSTLLKILSRITEPTQGRVQLHGRVASLLEVGTGFHPELTGRENIFLNGAILGMTRAEIKQQFDEIVAFAEVERFLDTPVKWYSSGMYVRLAFAVAAHLEPEILILDEVLAVGDAAFQQKCVTRMDQVSSSGRSTVLLVSHNLALVKSLCESAMLLESGTLKVFGAAGDVCDLYQSKGTNEGLWQRPAGSDALGFQRIEVAGTQTDIRGLISFGEPLKIRCSARLPETRSFISFIIKSASGIPVAELYDVQFNPSRSASDQDTIEARTNKPNLLPGQYTLDAWLGEGLHEAVERLVDCCSFRIAESTDVPTAQQLSLKPSGVMFLQSEWLAIRNDSCMQGNAT
jgi:lipopolysaccharide transport system ATP-binding protein